jgi:hypothetical protein
MDPNHADQQHNDEGADRPDDPAVVAAGKTTREHSSENQQQRQASQQHNRRPPLDDDEPPVERLAGDLLVGADAIRDYLVYLGMPEGTDPYYLKRARRWPIGNTGGGSGGGGKLIASKRRLTRHAEKITRGRGEPDDTEQTSEGS